MVTRYNRTLEQIARPFVETGIYESRDAFVKDLVKDVVASKVSLYEKKIRCSNPNTAASRNSRISSGVVLRRSRKTSGWNGKAQETCSKHGNALQESSVLLPRRDVEILRHSEIVRRILSTNFDGIADSYVLKIRAELTKDGCSTVLNTKPRDYEDTPIMCFLNAR